MNNDTQLNSHPEWENILGFVDNPDASEYQEIVLHLASCSDCRIKASEISQLQTTLKSSEFIQQHTVLGLAQSKSKGVTTALSDGDIEDYVDDKLHGKQQQNIAKLLQDEPQALKAALHYASHQSAMKRQIPKSETNTLVSKVKATQQNNTFNLFSSIKKLFIQPTPAWLMLPVTGFASVLLLLMFNVQFQTDNNKVKIASYQDNAVIQFSAKNNQPGIGFFSNARKKTIAFDKVSIIFNDNASLNITWPKIKNALSYFIIIKKIDNKQTVVIAEKKLSSNSVTFKDIALLNNRRYQWILTGETSDNESFYATGGFVSQ